MLYSRVQRDLVSYLLPSSTFPSSLTCLRELNLSFCNLVRIPDAIGKLSCLEHLNLEGNNFTTLPNLDNLFRLYHLNLQHCKRFKYIPVLPSQTEFPSETCKLPLPYLTHEDLVGLILYNCPELVEREHCSSMVFSWMIQIFQVCILLPSSSLLLILFFFFKKLLLTHNFVVLRGEVLKKHV